MQNAPGADLGAFFVLPEKPLAGIRPLPLFPKDTPLPVCSPTGTRRRAHSLHIRTRRPSLPARAAQSDAPRPARPGPRRSGPATSAWKPSPYAPRLLTPAAAAGITHAGQKSAQLLEPPVPCAVGAERACSCIDLRTLRSIHVIVKNRGVPVQLKGVQLVLVLRVLDIKALTSA